MFCMCLCLCVYVCVCICACMCAFLMVGICVGVAEVFKSALEAGQISMSDVSLLVFDETHHTTKNHPFKLILSQHYAQIPVDRERPRVLGLSASPASGEDESETKKKLLQMEKDMEAQVLVPMESSQDLEKALYIPESQTVTVEYSMEEKRLLKDVDFFRKLLVRSVTKPLKALGVFVPSLSTKDSVDVLMNNPRVQARPEFHLLLSAIRSTLEVEVLLQEGGVWDCYQHMHLIRRDYRSMVRDAWSQARFQGPVIIDDDSFAADFPTDKEVCVCIVCVWFM